MTEEQFFAQIDRRITSIEKAVEKMSDGMVELVRHGEKLIAIADNTKLNRSDIEKLFTIFHDHEKLDRSKSPLLDSPVTLSLKEKAANWTKLQITLVTGASLGALKLLYDMYLAISVWIDKIGAITP